uniref:peptidylprolyl isomerase n=1 Tax=Stigonema sp. PCC 9446 TaxID=2099385 RepID=A0A2P0ZGG5_9CYAN|nr:PpiC-type peptidyl-prolyl cis-transl isomerase [Stigonema sp. PCC 9446]
MLKTIKITSEDILHQVKVSCKITGTIEEIVTCQIIEDAADEAGIKVEIEELQQAADKIRLDQKLDSANDTWTWLEKHSLSLDDFEEIAYTTIISQKLAKHLFKDKVESFFLANKLDYASVVMYEIVLSDEDLVLELFYAIKEGEMSFYDAAHQYIQDVELRRKCGYRGKVSRKDLKPEISATIFGAKPPQLLKPIVTSKGVHLVLVEEIIQPQLDEKLKFEIISDLWNMWLKQQVEQVEVVRDFVSKH